MEFSLTMPGGAVTMNDVMVTLGTATAALVAWRQKSKDEQIKARDETIEFLKSQIVYLQGQINDSNRDNSTKQ